MSDLPTRDSVELAIETYMSDWTALDIERVLVVVDAYANGSLMTEVQWIQALAHCFKEGTDDMGVVMENEQP